jgi:hypothetical protein
MLNDWAKSGPEKPSQDGRRDGCTDGPQIHDFATKVAAENDVLRAESDRLQHRIQELEAHLPAEVGLAVGLADLALNASIGDRGQDGVFSQ